jgi:hypothetical protein
LSYLKCRNAKAGGTSDYFYGSSDVWKGWLVWWKWFWMSVDVGVKDGRLGRAEIVWGDATPLLSGLCASEWKSGAVAVHGYACLSVKSARDELSPIVCNSGLLAARASPALKKICAYLRTRKANASPTLPAPTYLLNSQHDQKERRVRQTLKRFQPLLKIIELRHFGI